MKNSGKTFFLIPGFKMQIRDKPYVWLVKYLEDQGIRVVKTLVVWNYRTLSQNTNEFISFFNKHKGEENYILGFSYGAVIALLAADIVKPKKIFLCSLSPDFVEDWNDLMPDLMLRERKLIGKRRYADTQTRSGKELARKLLVPAVVFYGEVEGKKYPALKKRSEETVHLAKNATLVVVKDAPHQIDFPAYIDALKKELVF